MATFRRLILIAVASGTFAGLLWFGLQYFAVIPLIETAEKYETGAKEPAHDAAHQHHNEGWQPTSRLQRNALTALATVLTGIGFAAALFGLATLTGQQLNAARGALWGLAAFGCVSLAPGLGLPPQPPGAAVADLTARQLWWVATVSATAIGLYLIVGRSRSWPTRLGGVLCLLLPHAIGAPAAVGNTIVPVSLVRQFVAASLVTTGLFWIALGTAGGLIHGRLKPTTDYTDFTDSVREDHGDGRDSG